MSSSHDLEKGSLPEHVEHHSRGAIHLTDAQYERLFFQPAPPRAFASGQKWQFGNPTVLCLISYLLALSPTVCYFSAWDGTSTASFPALVGVFYFAGGMGMTIGAVCEWIMGNTFPFVVFATFGGFWLSVANLFDPSKQVLSAFPNGGLADPSLNHGLQFFFTFWAILAMLYLVASLRTNVVFAIMFLTMSLLLCFIVAAYRNAALGNTDKMLLYLKVAGAFGIVNCIDGWYLAVILVFAAVDMPVNLPVGDLSWFLKGKKVNAE